MIVVNSDQVLRAGHRPRSLVAEGCARLEAVSKALGLENEPHVLLSTFRQMTASWGETPVGRGPSWASDVCEDHTPFEFSVAIQNGRPELRILVEAMDFPASLESNRHASLRLNQELEREGKVSLDRVRLVEDLFLPSNPQGRFAIWHAAVFRRGCAPEFKLYFNLQAQGKSKASTLTEAALERMGFRRAWPALAEVMGRRSIEKDELLYFSLDLSEGPNARVKVYVRHHGGRAADLEIASSIARSYQPGAVTAFLRKMANNDGPYGGRGPLTCFSYTDPCDERPASTTAYIAMPGATPNDAHARARISRYLSENGLPDKLYDAGLEALRRRPLDAGSSLHSYAAFRWQDGPRVTVYLSPELYRVEPPRQAAQAWAPKTRERATEIVRHFEEHAVTSHPLFARLRREPVDLRKLAILMANFQEAVVRDFPRRLATLTARVSDEAVRSILAKQLNDELGGGDVSRAHRVLFERLMRALQPFAPATLDGCLAPGRELGRAIEACYVTEDPHAGVGASLVVEVGGKQVDTLIADEFRRQQQIPPSDLEWLFLHSTLEVEHVNESVELAEFVPAEGSPLEAAWRGALSIGNAARRYFDALYRIFYT